MLGLFPPFQFLEGPATSDGAHIMVSIEFEPSPYLGMAQTWGAMFDHPIGHVWGVLRVFLKEPLG